MWRKLNSFRRYWSDPKVSKIFLLRYAIGQALARSGLGRFLPFATRHYRLFLTHSPVAMVLFGDPGYARDEEDFLDGTVHEGDVVLDVGANIGTFSLRAAKLVGPTGQVFAFEGNPRTAGIMERNVKLNGLANVQVTAAAVGDQNGNVTFAVGAGDDVDHVTATGSGIEVLILRLDDFEPLRSVDRIRMMNIDVEGYELLVLKGGERVVSMTEQVIFEAYEANCLRAGYDLAALFDWFLSRGFRLTDLKGRRIDLSTAGRREVQNVLATR